MRATFSLANASSVYNTQCLLSARTDTDCIFPQNFAKHIATPMHVTQSQYDAWQLQNELQVCVYARVRVGVRVRVSVCAHRHRGRTQQECRGVLQRNNNPSPPT